MNRTSDGGRMTRTTDADTMKPTRRPNARARHAGLSVATAAVAVLVLAACGSSSSSSTSGSSSSGGLTKAASNPNATLIVNNAVPIATLDPTFTTTDQDPGFDGAMSSTLTQVDQEPAKVAGTTQQNLGVSAVKPYLAKSYEFSE